MECRAQLIEYSVEIPTSDAFTVKDLIGGDIPDVLKASIETAHDMGSSGVEIHEDTVRFGFSDPAKAIEFYSFLKESFPKVEIREIRPHNGGNMA